MELHLHYIRGRWRAHWQSVCREHSLGGVGVLLALSLVFYEFQMHFKSFLLQLIKIFLVVSWSIFLSFFILLYVNKDTVLCIGVLITSL